MDRTIAFSNLKTRGLPTLGAEDGKEKSPKGTLSAAKNVKNVKRLSKSVNLEGG